MDNLVRCIALVNVYIAVPCFGQSTASDVDPIITTCSAAIDPKEAARCICAAYNKADSLVEAEYMRAIRDLYIINAVAYAQRPIDSLEVDRVKWLQESLQRSQRAWETMRDADRLIAEGSDPRWVEHDWQAKRIEDLLEVDQTKASKRAFASCQQAFLESYDRIRRLRDLVPSDGARTPASGR